jgi:hypothetical protein
MHFAFPLASLLLSAFALNLVSAFLAAVARIARRQIVPLYPPHVRHYGSASRASRRTLRHKMLNTAVHSLAPAAYSRPMWRQFRQPRQL